MTGKRVQVFEADLDLETYDPDEIDAKVARHLARGQGRRALFESVRELASEYDPGDPEHVARFGELVDLYGAVEVARLFRLLGDTHITYIENLTVMVSTESTVASAMVVQRTQRALVQVLSFSTVLGGFWYVLTNWDKVVTAIIALIFG